MVTNVGAGRHPHATLKDRGEVYPDAIKAQLKAQLFQPVRWVETVKYLQNKEVEYFVECGPGKVLMSLNKRIAKSANHLAIIDSSTLDNVLEAVND